MEQDIVSQHYKMWTREATSILIEQYRTNECMWMTTSPFYRNKQKRSEALINIAVAVSKLRPQTTAEDIKNKINGIRTQYVSEINKLILANNRGEPYEPTLWCFEILSFLKPFTQPKQKSVNSPANGSWPRTFMPKPTQPQFATPAKPQTRSHSQPQEHQQSSPSERETPKTIKDFIFIKEESHDDDIEIIEDEDNFHTDDEYSNSHSSYHQEDKSYNEGQESFSATSAKEPTPPVTPNADSRFEEEEQTSNVRNLFSPSGISAEITLVPKKNITKRKNEEIVVNHVEDKKKKTENETNSNNDEMDDRISIFGKFVMSQMKIITDKVLLLKLEHTIQNAIIEAQLKQIELEEIKKDKNEKN